MVKHAIKAAQPEFRAEMQWNAKQALPDVADRVSLITENDLDPIEVHNAELVHGVRIPDFEPDAAVVRFVASLTGAARISDIVAACGCGGRGFRSVVRLIRTRELELATYERIDSASLVRRRLI